MVLRIDSDAAETFQGNGKVRVALEQLEAILSARCKYRLILDEDPPPSQSPQRHVPVYGCVFDDQREQFAGGIANTEHGIPIWE